MTRIPSHTVEDAPPASRPLLEDMLQFSPTGRLLNMHAQMAHAPVVLDVVREAAANSGHVSDVTWGRATGSGWSSEQLAEAFAYLGLTVFTAYFLNYAATELDIPGA
jgi:hypothetical protein